MQINLSILIKYSDYGLFSMLIISLGLCHLFLDEEKIRKW